MTSTFANSLRSAEAAGAIMTGEMIWRHIEAEHHDDNVAGIVATVSEVGPFAASLNPEVDADGNAYQRVVTTRQGIADHYASKKDITRSLRFLPFNEILTSWYGFEHGINEVMVKADGQLVQSEIIVLFPIFGRDGITGELVGARDMAVFGGAPAQQAVNPAEVKLRNLALHDQLLDAFRATDVDAVMATMSGHVQTNIRDRVAETGTVTELHGAAAAGSYFEQFFGRVRVLGVDVVTRLIDEWFAFAELRWNVEIDGSAGEWLTAEFCTFAKDGRIELHAGHGTDLQPAS